MTQFRCMSIRIFTAFLIFTAVFGYLIFHLYKVQIMRHDELFAKAKLKYTGRKTTEANRGEFFDYYGNLLIGNRPYGIIFADPSAVPVKDFEKAVDFLSAEFELDKDKVRRGLSRKSRTVMKKGVAKTVPVQYFLLKTQIPYEEFEQHKRNIENSFTRRYVHCETGYARYYPKENMLANILGLTTLSGGKITPVTGMEKKYAADTQSVSGKVVYERTLSGQPISFSEVISVQKKDGGDVYLTIREPIQAILEEELDKLMAQHRPKSAYAIMADPYTGDILAMAQRPSFNPNDRSSMKSNCWRNRMAEDVFEPGSIIKPFAVAGALDRNIVTPDTVIDCENGRWFYGGHPLKDDHKIDKVTVSEVIKQSSNIGTAKIAILMGKYAVDATLRSFGFGQYSGLELPNESRGLYRNVEKWAKVSLTRIPIGQGMAASPLQLVRGYCMLANGGYPVKLRICDRTVTSDGKVHRIPIEKTKSVFTRKATHKEIVDMMKLVTEPGGTAAQAAIRGYYVAGKTGTAQKVINGRYSNKHHIASFVGFVPADKPRLVLLVTADEPSGKTYYGGSVTGPYFRSIAERTLRYWYVPPDIDPAVYDANRRIAEKKVRAAKIKIWEAERKAREARRKNSASGNTRKYPAVKNEKAVPDPVKNNKQGKTTVNRRYYGTYTALTKKR